MDASRNVGIGPRLGAVLYDMLIVGALLIAATALALMTTSGEAIAAGTIWFQIYVFAVTGAYFIWSWWRRGQTLGMIAWRIRIADHQVDQPITLQQSAIRFVSAVGLFGVGFLWTLFDRRNRSWYDILSRTRITRVAYSPDA